MNGVDGCAVRGCANPISGPNNLCNAHRLPGFIVRIGDSTMVITYWYAEHAGECGVILLNDFALRDLFDGRGGFEARLAKQGFTNVSNLATPEELARRRAKHKVGKWGVPWQTTYPWEVI